MFRWHLEHGANSGSSVFAGFGDSSLSLWRGVSLFPSLVTTSEDPAWAATTVSTGALSLQWRFERGAAASALSAGHLDSVRFFPGRRGAVEFQAAEFEGSESLGRARLLLRRHGFTDPASVRLTLQPETAGAGSDFTAGDVTVAFADGSAKATVDVAILEDNLVENVETLLARIEPAPSGSAGIGPLASARIIIRDEDAFTYAAWAAQFFAAGEIVGGPGRPGDDADLDGVLNLLEYAFDSHPLQAGFAAMPTAGMLDDTGDGLTYPAITFRRRKAVDLVYTVQRSADLVAWQDGSTYAWSSETTTTPASVEFNRIAGEPAMVTVRDSQPTAPDRPTVFLRVKVAMVP
jgi:hypothetical protein